MSFQGQNPAVATHQAPVQQQMVPAGQVAPPPAQAAQLGTGMATNAQIAQLLNPQNPALQAALIQAVLHTRGTVQGTVTMDDIADYLMAQGRTMFSI